MPKMTTCLCDGKPISIGQALSMRADADKRKVPYPLFHCDKCDSLVGAHATGKTGAKAHFEHRIKNPQCLYFKQNAGK